MRLFTFIAANCIFLFAACNSPRQSAANAELYLPDDLEATLWAESPMLYNPTNIDVDAKGRVWVTEAVNYRKFNNKKPHFKTHEAGDRVLILEDTDNDGVADTVKVFVQDTLLVAPMGIAVIGNKVIVSCTPNLIVYTDEDGDDIPDKTEIFLTGFGGMDHDHSLHALLAGPDGKWHFNVGNAGPHMVTDKSGWTLRSGSVYVGGTPYNTKNEGNLKSDDGRVWVGGLALRINPDGTGLTVRGHNFRNAYELTVDSRGNYWQNDNDDEVAACRVSWLMEGGNAGFFSKDGTRSWQADQRPDQEIFTAHWHQEDPGVMPVGDRSGAGSPTGIVLNESDALGKKYRGLLLSADAGRNVIFGYTPKREKSGWIPADRQNFITSLSEDNALYVWNDTSVNKRKENWFRPSDVAIGTDGAIYVADWYDPVVGGHQTHDSLAYGRIYRITPKNKKLKTPVINLGTTEGQLEAFRNPAINVRHLGFLVLREQGDAVVNPVSALLKDDNPYIQARAIWLLAALGDEGKKRVEELLQDKDENIRVVAFRALRVSVTDILPFAEQLRSDPSSCVRREVALALQDLPFDKTKNIYLDIIKRYEGEDRWYLNAVSAGVQGHEDELYPDIRQSLAAGAAPVSWSNQMADWAWELHPVAAIEDLKVRATAPSLPAAERRKAITAIAFMKDKKAVDAMMTITKTNLTDAADQAGYWLAFRQGNDWFDLANWKNAGLNTAYERKAAAMRARMQAIFDKNLPLVTRQGRLRQIARDSVGGQLLLALAAEKKFPDDLVPVMEEVIFKNPDVAVRVQAGNYFKQPGSVKQFSIADIAGLKGDAEKGKLVFAEFCASCHKVGSGGMDIGPELTNIRKKFDKTGLLDAIIYPSAAILLGYEAWLINTKDGNSYFGFLLSENKQTITIKDVSGQKHTIPVDNISTRQKQEKSLMPEPVIAGVSEQQLADVAAYLLQGK
ncbi:MAG: c-type cytochrome [Chitinophagaceae bacterium]|nr:c-type cytochrome [Chitinophagaceae bacterium]MCW5929472.1 c-type cytochrome [Chitinophagaceae bacterium]